MGVASETKLSSDLESARRGVRAQESSEDARWGGDSPVDKSKLRIGDVAAHGLIEVGMVQNVKSLCADLELCAFPVWEAEVLHHRNVGVEVVGPIDLVAALIAETGYAASINGRGELIGIHARFGCHEVVEHIGTAAGKRPNIGVGEENIAVVEAVQGTSRSAIDCSERQARPHEERAGDRPIQQRVQQKIVKLRCVVKVREVGLLADVVVSVAVVVALQVEGVLRIENAGIGSETEGQESAVRNIIQCMAPGEGPLELEAIGDMAGERSRQAVVIGDAVIADFGDGAEAGIRRRGGQADETCGS